MCLTVYLASAEPLSPTSLAPGTDGPALAALHESEFAVRAHFTLPHVYTVLSTQGCACGFLQWFEDPNLDDLERAAARLDHGFLADLVERASAGAPVEVYSVWSGNEGRAPRRRKDVSRGELGAQRLAEENVFCRVAP